MSGAIKTANDLAVPGVEPDYGSVAWLLQAFGHGQQPSGQSLTAATPLQNEIPPGTMPTTRQVAAQPVSRYVNPATGQMTAAGTQRARDVTDTAMAMGGVGPSGGGFRAYHGSPHTFDQFNMSKIGTGEGAQAYGHGMYIADAEDVALGYRDKLSNRLTVDPAHAETHAALEQQMVPLQQRMNAAYDRMFDHSLHPDERAAARVQYDNANAEMGRIQDAQGKLMIPDPGHMYEVQVNADPAHFLDWDKPLSEQHPKVQDAINSIADNSVALSQRMVDAQKNNVVMTGNDVVSALAREGKFNDPRIAAALQKAGIPGIRYLDAGSRGAGEGSSNTVVFDANAMNIIRRYGLAGLMAGGVGAAASGGKDQAK